MKKTLIVVLASLASLVLNIFIGIVVISSIANIISYVEELDQKIVYIPSRKPDFNNDTHGGFNGDGDRVSIYVLSDKEVKQITNDLANNKNWKQIDEEISRYLYGGVYGYYAEGFIQSRVPELEDGYYSFYNKQTKSCDFSQPGAYSHNYIVYMYSPRDKILYVYELDT